MSTQSSEQIAGLSVSPTALTLAILPAIVRLSLLSTLLPTPTAALAIPGVIVAATLTACQPQRSQMLISRSCPWL